MDREQDNLVAKYFSVQLTDAETAELEAWLLADQERVSNFAEKLLIHQNLRDGVADDIFAGVVTTQPAAVETLASPPRATSWLARIHPSAWAIAASIAVVATLWLVNDQRQVATRVDSRARVAENIAPRVVAYLGRTSNCVWQGEGWNEGSQLTVGSRLSLKSGVAEVIFDNGARLKALGPCDIYMDDAQACSVRLGSASVYVPESAFGFKVVMPSGIVVDLGTEFGVTVDDAGASEVHVFKGEVAFQPLTERGDHFEKAIRLTADRAAQYSLAGTTLQEFEANEAKFSWRNRVPLGDDEAPALPVREGIALWLAADRFVEVDQHQRVSCWTDLQIAENPSAEDALQLNPDHRPWLIPDAIGEQPAVRFEEGAFLLTPPLATSNEQTVFLLLALRQTTPDFQTVINYNGPPQRIVGPLGGMVSPSVFEVCLRDRNHDQRFAVCGELFTGYEEGGKTDVIKNVVEDFDRLPKDKPMALAVRYSLRDQKMSLFIDGRERKSAHASTRIAITSRKILGRHPIFETDNGLFGGDLGEVIIFNRALGDDEVLAVSNYLADRYQLAVAR